VNPWLETGGAMLLAASGIVLAFWLSKAPRPYWVAAFIVCLIGVCLFGVERYTVGLEFVPPFSWVATGRMRFVLAAIAGSILLLTPALQLPRRREKFLVASLTVLFLIGFVVMPFFMAAVIRKTLASITTRIDADGVCLQQTSYTCGAAAAVTALRKLGLRADEGPIAIWSHTSQFGITPEELAETLRSHYGAEGLEVHYRPFHSVAELRGPDCTLAVVKYDVLVDHFVAVLGLTNGQVIVGDPLNGRILYTEEEFARLWRFSGISLRRIRPMPRLQAASPTLHGERADVAGGWGQVDYGALETFHGPFLGDAVAETLGDGFLARP
jgi:predicted double-glycine peptidase